MKRLESYWNSGISTLNRVIRKGRAVSDLFVSFELESAVILDWIPERKLEATKGWASGSFVPLPELR